jgi:hypothetical protein
MAWNDCLKLGFQKLHVTIKSSIMAAQTKNQKQHGAWPHASCSDPPARQSLTSHIFS